MLIFSFHLQRREENMEHVHKYNEAVTKLKLLLDQTSNNLHSNAGGGQDNDGGIAMAAELHSDTDVILSRQGSLRRVAANHYQHQADHQKKKWASQEDLFHASHHTKGELRGLVIHQEEYISQLEEVLHTIFFVKLIFKKNLISRYFFRNSLSAAIN